MRTKIGGRLAARAERDAPLLVEPLSAPEGAEGRLTNAPEITVSELSGALKQTVEERFGYVRVRGEVSNYRGPHSSGHAYFCLKDAAARIDAVVWRTTFARMRIKPEEGMEVIATGKVTTFPGKSSYQIVVETLEPAGIGALMAMLEARRRQFAAEGLFDATRKRALPFLPHAIGVVTSPTGAVIRDILHRIAGRFPRHVLLWPVRVQGDGSATEVAQAIRGFNALAAGGLIPMPQVLIVARGGGSLEDLWGFNDEAVLRAAAEGLIPLISAVGHETDWTLLDHIADLRAPTPTGAAELCVPVRADLLVGLDRLSARHASGALRLLERTRDALWATARALPSGEELLALPRQRLDRAGAQLPSGLRIGADRRRLALLRISGRLSAQSPQARLARETQQLKAVGFRLKRARLVAADRRQGQLGGAGLRLGVAFAARLRLEGQAQQRARDRLGNLAERLARVIYVGRERRSARLEALAQMMGSLSYRSVLARGYALVRDDLGRPLRTAAGLAAGSMLDIEFADDSVKARIAGTQTEAAEAASEVRTRPRPKPASSPGTRQGSLF